MVSSACVHKEINLAGSLLLQGILLIFAVHVIEMTYNNKYMGKNVEYHNYPELLE